MEPGLHYDACILCLYIELVIDGKKLWKILFYSHTEFAYSIQRVQDTLEVAEPAAPTELALGPVGGQAANDAKGD